MKHDTTEEKAPTPDRGTTGENETNTTATTVAGRREGGDTRCS